MIARPLRLSAALLAVAAFGSAGHASDPVSSYDDERCPFVVRFGPELKPVTERAGEVVTMTALASGFRLSVACIPNPSQGSSRPLEGEALYDRLAMLAASLGVHEPKILVPMPPAASCGLITGTIAPRGAPTRVRTEFCYGPRAYLIVETTTDGSSRAEDSASAVLNSINQRTDQNR